MEGGRGSDPGFDDWFDEPEPPTETQSAVGRGGYEDADEVWVLPEDEEPKPPGRHREIVVAGRTLTTTQAAIIGILLLAVFFAILAAVGVFNGSTPTTPQVTPTVKPLTTTTTPTTTANTTPTTKAPSTSQTLKAGDTGQQVTLLQEALVTLGFLSSKPDGIYGAETQNAVEKFQGSAGLDEDGIAGPQTLTALQKQLAKQ
jgi:Putative peptidoglycan binding domain